MKKIFILLIAFICVTSTVYAEQKADFSCIEVSGFRYEFYLFIEAPKIHVYDEKNNEVNKIDNITFSFKPFDSSPPKTEYNIQQVESGNLIAWFEFVEGENEGHGEMVENDQKMKCSRPAEPSAKQQ